MSIIKCKLLCHSVSAHIQQLYTGFKLLADDGLIDLTQQICIRDTNYNNSPQYLRHAAAAHLKVQVTVKEGNIILYFDNHDSKEIDKQTLEDCDFYFKRSYSSEYISKTHASESKKIHPLGLNYLVFPNNIDLFGLRRNLTLSTSPAQKLVSAIGAIDCKNFVTFYPRLRHIYSAPRFSFPPKVLFIVAAYDPYDVPDRPKEKIEEREYNNETRANCVRVLRKELGSRFYGGFVHNPFSIEKYKDVLMDIPGDATKENYLKRLGDFPVCVATTGLHGSIGWKLAEYVAFSKAIVSEKLLYDVPGQFRPNINYLEFSSPQECAYQSIRLLDDDNLRHKMMTNNSKYYDRHVRPDMLVLNALYRAIQMWS